MNAVRCGNVEIWFVDFHISTRPRTTDDATRRDVGPWATPGGLLFAFVVIPRGTTRLMKYAGGAAPSRTRLSRHQGANRAHPLHLVASPRTRRARLRGDAARGTIRRPIPPDRKENPTEAPRQADHRDAPAATRGDRLGPLPQRRPATTPPTGPGRLHQ